MRTVLASCLLIVIVLSVSFFFLYRTGTVPPASGRIFAQTSQDWGSIPIGSGECAVVNNTWNRGAAGKGFEQSVFLEELAGKTAIGWHWRAPWHLLPRVVATRNHLWK